MKCPKCGTSEGIKWFLRHQAIQEENDDTDANVITVLCTQCGENQSFFLSDCLEIIFSNWKEPELDLNELGGLFETGFPQDNFNFEMEDTSEQ